RSGRRHHAHAELVVAGLQRDLVVVLERPHLARLHLSYAEVVEDRSLHVGIDAPVVAVRLRDAHLTAIERRNDLVGSHARISAARRHCSRVGTHAQRTSPPPAGPKNAPGAQTMPCSRSCSANGIEGPPTSIQRWKVAAEPASRGPFAARAGST